MPKPRQFIARNNAVACPVCDTELTVVSEQDQRVAVMLHEGVNTKCPRHGKYFRVDRFTGYGEEHEKPAKVQLQKAWKSRKRSEWQGQGDG